MRGSWLYFVSAALTMSAYAAIDLTPALAGPAYTSDQVIAAFTKAPQKPKTRGICLMGKHCDDQPPVTAAAPVVFDLLVGFEFDSDKLTPAARENLNQFARALQDARLKGRKFEVDGHTDATGLETYNMGLSERRAASVVGYLSSLGVDPAVLTSHGFGPSKPRVSDPYSPENRRVETHIIE